MSGVYYLVFHRFGAEPRYRVILSVTLHGMWVLDRPADCAPPFLGVVFAGWLGFHAPPLLRFLLF